MLIAVGDGHPRWLEVARLLRQRGLVDLVYPEFFDDKDSLIGRRWNTYLRKLRRCADAVKVAVWPDYCYDPRLRDRFNVEWVFPLHRRSELDFALKVADYIGFPNRDDLRGYSLGWFTEQKRAHGFKVWLLGLKPRFLHALHAFDACDITTMSVPSYRYSKWYEIPLEEWASFVRRIKTSTATTLDAWW
jgi:hypothetical protein